MRPEGLVRCNKCGGSCHPSNHVRAHPLSEAFTLQCASLWQHAINVAMARLPDFTVQMYGLLGTVMTSSALSVTCGMITLLNLCTHNYCTSPNPLAALMWRRPLNNAILFVATHRRLGMASDGTDVQVVVCIINKWKVRIRKWGIYNVRDPLGVRVGKICKEYIVVTRT